LLSGPNPGPPPAGVEEGSQAASYNAFVVRRDEAIQKIRGVLPELAAEFSVRSVAVFGSTARGESGAGSDVDVLVEFDRPASLFDLAAVRLRLREALGCEVDVGTPGGLRPRIKDDVMREAVRVA